MPTYSDSHFLSPLRYPGGKGRLGPFVAELIRSQADPPSRYVEPFAGGGGVALRLLVDNVVDTVVLNDLNPGISAFWRTVFTDNDHLASRVEACHPTIDEWHRQMAIYRNPADAVDDLELGFATFFLNRTNRSGILDARPIGGLDQTGKWGITARYHPDRLAARIRRLSEFTDRVVVCEADGIDLAERHLGDDALVYLDPPYLEKADDLYLDTLSMDDHRRLARLLAASESWLLTYDRAGWVLRWYQGRCAQFGIAHTAAAQHVGREFAVFSDDLELPPIALLGRGDGRWLRGRGPSSAARHSVVSIG